MKTLHGRIITGIFMLGLLISCEKITSNNEQEEQYQTNILMQLVEPENSSMIQSDQVDLQWNRIKGAQTYQLLLSDNKNFDDAVADTTIHSTSFTATSLTHETTYYWKVFPIKNNHSGPWSDVWTFTTGSAIESTEDDETNTLVTLLSPADNSYDVSIEPEFTWEVLEGISEYNYQLSDNSSFSTIITEETVPGTSFTTNGLSYQKNYYWRVKADRDGDAWSRAWGFTTESGPEPPSAGSGSFVSTQNANFVADGNTFNFVGTNAYYLPNYEKINSGVVDRALNLFEDTGINVVRMWGFYDGYDCGYSKTDPNENVIQTAPGVYSEHALRDLDNVIAKGKARGVKFIIPFVNYWDQLGGVCQYNTWAGAASPSRNMGFFITNSQTQKWFKDYISMLLNRVNTVTGVAYKDEPAIFAWQIMNEGRNSGRDAGILRDWYQEIARYIKSIDTNHMVATGEEGFDEGTPSQYSVSEYSNTYVLRANEGTSYILNTSIPEIDFGSAHWYPTDYGFGSTVNSSLIAAQRAWLEDHKQIAESAGKPFIIGEFGFPGWADDRVHTMYDELYQHAESIDLDGNMIWQLVADGTKCWEFGGNICYPEGRADTELYTKFKQHVFNTSK